MDNTQGFRSTHKRAAELVEKDPTFAYAVSTALRKRIVGRDVNDAKYELLIHLAYSAWNKLGDLQADPDNPKYTVRLLNLGVETLMLGYDILTERYVPNAYTNGSPKG